MSTTPDDGSWPWFETDALGLVVAASAAAERLGIEDGAPLPRACELLMTVVTALEWRAVAEDRWRCQGALPVDRASAELRLVQTKLRLQDEVRRRRYLERQLISATENEQRRISLELHDGLGQHLSGLAYTARSMATRLGDEQHGLAQEADWMARLLRDAVGRVRAMSRGLWPVGLERQSLPQALAALATDVEQLYGISVQVRAEGFDAESAHAAHHLFRVVQEAINNALKHGQARNIEVRVESLPPRAMLSVVSDGKPMDTEARRAGRGLGLISMQLRADALGGELSIEALAGGGVEVCLLWTPTPQRQEGRQPKPPQSA
jgi:signal transduction histidine kinase